MKQDTPRKHFLPYGFKLMFSYFLFVLIPVIVVGWAAYDSSINSIREQTRQNLQGTLGQIRDNIQYRSEGEKRLSDQIYFDNKIQGLLRYFENGWIGYELMKEYLMPTLSNAVHMSNIPVLLKVYIDNKAIPEIYNDQSPQFDPLRFADYEILHMDRLKDEAWLKELQLPDESYRGTEFVWLQVENDKEFHNISLIRRLMDISQKKQIGLTRTIVRLSDLMNAVDYHKIGESSKIFLLDKQGRTIKASGSNSPDSYESEVGKSDHLMISETLPGLNWKLVALIPNSLLEKSAKKVRNLTIMVCLISSFILSIIGMWVSNYFSKRVRKIVTSLNAFKEGDFHKRLFFSGNDEFTQIADAFNKMGENTDELIKEVYLANMLKKEAELESLQAQINPHFLYNTLSSISRLAKFGEIDQLHEMVMGLAKFYRLTLNDGRLIIAVNKELEQVKTYIDIQQIKYRDRLHVGYEFQADVFGFDTVKLILQPFVENALEHALFSHSINLRITASLVGSTIEFKIIDDGIGMNKETIDQIFTRDGIHVGYGIRNVDERIKLQYGPKYGVQLFSRLGIGSCVRITIPAVKEIN